MNENSDSKTTREKGQTIILVALALIALIAFVGLATDVALVYVAERHLQRAIDAAALAAANKLPDQTEAEAAAYEFTRLHGYTFAPGSEPLDIAFPISNPPRKIAAVTGTVDVDLAFLQVIGWDTAQVMAEGIGESAPLDVYLVLDLSHSMVYDTHRPAWWNSDICKDTPCPNALCELGYSYPGCDPDISGSFEVDDSWCQCRAYYCNYEGELSLPGGGTFTKVADCDPLDAHIKDSAIYFIDQLDPTYDRVGVVAYDIQGTLIITLTNDFDMVKTKIRDLNAYQQAISQPSGTYYQHYCTNIGDGIMVANAKMSLPSPDLGGEGGRTDSIWSIILLTDGKANRYRECWTNPESCSLPLNWCTPGCAKAERWSLVNAESSWDNHKITLYTIGYGQEFVANPSYQKLLTCMADYTDNGSYKLDSPSGYPIEQCETENFWGVPDEAGLRQAFEEIAERIYTRLLQ